MQPATLWLFAGSPLDDALATWLAAHGPDQLRLLPAQFHPRERLVALRYEGSEGPRNGAAALGAALRHLPGSWALMGTVLGQVSVGRATDGFRKLFGLRGAPPDDESPRPKWVTGPLPMELVVP